jgi:hypothetical protein
MSGGAIKRGRIISVLMGKMYRLPGVRRFAHRDEIRGVG